MSSRLIVCPCFFNISDPTGFLTSICVNGTGPWTVKSRSTRFADFISGLAGLIITFSNLA